MSRDFEAKQRAASGLLKMRYLAGQIVHEVPPGTLAEVLDDVRRGHLFDYALSGFLREFHGDPDPASRRRRISDEPDLAPNRCLNAILGAAGEHLARRWDLDEPPPWTAPPERFMDQPYFMNPHLPKSHLFEESPPEFRRRRIFTVAEPLVCSESYLNLWTSEFVEISAPEPAACYRPSF
jgi:hypothetical protein